jgi:hypothetical protein
MAAGLQAITFVYGLYDPTNGKLRYVGKTLDPEARLSGHLSQPHTRLREWIRSLKTLGLKPEMRILQECESDGSAEEMQWIQASIEGGCELLNAPGERNGRRPTERGAYNPHPPRQIGRVSDENWAIIKAAGGKNFTKWAVDVLLKAAKDSR